MLEDAGSRVDTANDDLNLDGAGQTLGSERTLLLAEHAVKITRTERGGSVRMLAPDATEMLCIDITAAGATLRLARGLSIAIEGALSFEADSVSIHGRNGLDLTSGRNANIAAAVHLGTSSRATTIETTHGDIKIDANDDVVLQGERIRANC